MDRPTKSGWTQLPGGAAWILILAAALPALGSRPTRTSELPPATCDPATDREIVRISPDWKALYPFSARFEKEGAAGRGRHVVDLKAARFSTDELRVPGKKGVKRFLRPDLSSFVPELVPDSFARASRDYCLVQAADAAGQKELRTWLKDEGIPILDYIPDNAYLVRLNKDKWTRLAGRPEVFWAGPFFPALRVNPKLDYVIETSPEHWLEMTAIFDGAPYASRQALLSALPVKGLSLTSLTRTSRGWRARFQGTAVSARDLVLLPGCLWVERYVPFGLDNNIARSSSDITTGRGSVAGPVMDVEDVWARGIRGEGQIASAADTGLSTGDLSTLHKDFGDQSDSNNPMRVLHGYAWGRATWDDNQTTGGGHGTHTSGSIVGNGFRSGSTPSTNTFPTTCYAGTAPKAQFIFQSIMDSSGNLGGLPSNLNTLFQQTYDDGARVHSNSWGAPVAGDYTSDSQDVDEFSWDNKDMVITFSAGNSGVDTSPADGVIDTDSIGAPGTAKNCITVGASENYLPGFVYEYPQGDCTGDGFTQQAWGWGWSSSFGTEPVKSDLMADNASGMGAFSSRGPTNDGRFKPDITAPGIAVISTRTDKNQAYEQWGICSIPSSLQAYYMTMGGTSMANPLTAGTATLVRQYYADGWHPNGSQTTNASANAPDGFNPSSALVKATLINGAWDMTPGQYGTGSTQELPPAWDTGHDLPNNAEGYGRVDLEHSLFPGSGWGDNAARKMEVHDVTPGLQTSQNDSYTFIVTSSANPLVVTLVWTDPYGATSAGTELVNNLDLTVTAPDATVYYPNGLNKTSGADTKNNVEQVKVTSPSSGLWSVQVNGTSVPGNGQADTDTQPYALVVSGVITPPCTVPGAPTLNSATANGDNRIDLAWTNGSPAGTTFNVYRSDGSSCPGGTYTEIASGVTGTTYSDTTVSGGVTYSYEVTAVDSTGGCESAMSNCQDATATGSCITPPTFAGLASVTNPGNATCTLNLAWSAATANCGGAITYNVYRSTSAGFTPGAGNRIATGVAATSYSDTNALANGTPYYYVVRAVDGSNGVEDANVVEKSGTPTGTTTTASPIDENFGSGDPPTGWSLIDGGSGTQHWTTTNPGGRTPPSGITAPFEIIDSDEDGRRKSQDDSLITPAFDCTGATTVTLEFDTYYKDYDSNDYAYIDVSSNGGSTWTTHTTWTSDVGSSSTASHQTLDITTLAAGSANTKVRFHYVGVWGWYWLVDNVKVTVTSTVSCTTVSPVKPVPDGKWVPGTAAKAIRANADGTSIDLTWDVSICTNAEYNLYYGKGSDLSSYTLTGSDCDMGNGGSSTWSAPAVPGGETFIWWTIVGTDGVSTESSWGKDSDGSERHPAASAQCGFTAKSTAATCP